MAKKALLTIDGQYKKIKNGLLTVDSVHKKVKKAYVTIGGVYRPCWSGGELAYYGTITSLSATSTSQCGGHNNNYALFSHGRAAGDVAVKNVDAYSASLTRSSATQHPSASQSGSRGSGQAGEYCVFFDYESSSTSNSIIFAYNGSLTQTVVSRGSTDARSRANFGTVGNYAVVTGGFDSSSSTMKGYYAVNSSLTTSTGTGARTKSMSKGVTLGDKLIFTGGDSSASSGVSGSRYLRYCDSSLTWSSKYNFLPNNRYNCTGAATGEYALFCGISGAFLSDVDAVSSSLTLVSCTALSEARKYIAGESIGEYAVFAGGQTGQSGSTYKFTSAVDVYDSSLTRTNNTTLSTARYGMSSAVIGEYGLFAGGVIGSSGYDVKTTVDAFTVA